MHRDPTFLRVHEILHYDYQTGLFTWTADVGRGGRHKAGTVAGHIVKNHGYRAIGIDGANCYGHRLAFLYMTGAMPELQVDHIDGNRANNAWSNLRQATCAENRQNIRAAPSHNKTTGLLGVSFHKPSGLWGARIWVDGKKKSLRYHATPELAHQAYLTAKRQSHTFNQL